MPITNGYPYESIEDVVLNVSGAGTNLKIYVNFENTSLKYKGLEDAYYIFVNNDGNYSYSGNVEIKNASLLCVGYD